MNFEMKGRLLYNFANVMGIMFPSGKLENGGTCEFASRTCLKECCATACVSNKQIVGHTNKKKTYDAFLLNSVEIITQKISNELRENNCTVLTWFGCGDCPSFLTEKYFNIVKQIDELGFAQTGFTRNRKLWQLCKTLSATTKVILSIEDVKKETEKGMFSIADYEKGSVSIVIINKKRTAILCNCGSDYYENHWRLKNKSAPKLKFDCRFCYDNKKGCFS